MIDFKYDIEHHFDSPDTLKEFLKNKYQNENLHSSSVLVLELCSFDFDIRFPFYFQTRGSLETSVSNWMSNAKLNIAKSRFTHGLTLSNSAKEVVFEDSAFLCEITCGNRTSNLTFKNCRIDSLDLSETVFGKDDSDLGKLRIKSSNVFKTNFKNAKFHALVDFYYTTFHNRTIFYKTDFLNIIVFSATTFKENVLFTYTLLSDKVIMRSTNFEKGFDFSLSIIKGQLAIFSINQNYNYYKSVSNLIEEQPYEKAVSIDGIIPIQNQLETYRLLKSEFESQKNIPESLKFKLNEKKVYKRTLQNEKRTIQNVFDQFSLWLNWESNRHGTSYWRAFWFIVLVGGLFCYTSIIVTESYEATLDPFKWDYENGISFYVQFLIPTHKFNYLGQNIDLNWGFYILDFLGRLFVGYGIYQFIQAFRKFK